MSSNAAAAVHMRYATKSPQRRKILGEDPASTALNTRDPHGHLPRRLQRAFPLGARAHSYAAGRNEVF